MKKTYQCKNCGNQIKWEYLIPQEFESNWEFTILDQSRVRAKQINSTDDKNYRFRITCCKCLVDNFFDYIPDNELK